MRRILVVDDEPQIFPAIGTWPRQPGFRVSLADGGINRPATFEQATLLNVIGDGLSEAAARRRQLELRPERLQPSCDRTRGRSACVRNQGSLNT
jgi:DNA-binding response OmpR family regulator